jgi:hypothetical protein
LCATQNLKVRNPAEADHPKGLMLHPKAGGGGADAGKMVWQSVRVSAWTNLGGNAKSVPLERRMKIAGIKNAPRLKALPRRPQCKTRQRPARA